MGEILDRSTWVDIGTQLRGVGAQWWEENRSSLEGMAKDEARALFDQLRKRDLEAAKFEVVARMSREEWEAYRDGTTEQLKGIAVQRAKLLEALQDLGVRVAGVIGAAALERLR